MEGHAVSKLIGAPPGYIGHEEAGQLTEAVLRHPYTIILFDEIEKAQTKVFNAMLQILEDGRLTDGKGRTADFKNTLIIMTSNVGSSMTDLANDVKDHSYDWIKKLVIQELQKSFKPEFLNKLDEIIVFRKPTKQDLKLIADIMFNEVFERLKVKGIEVHLTKRFEERVIKKGFCPSYGARPLRRAILELLENIMAVKIFAGEIKEGNSIIVDVEYDGKPVVFNKRNNIQLSHWQKLPLLPLLVLLFLFAPLNHLQWL